MFFACGVSAYAAGIFHLFTHAFFKALLFLGAGSVIHAMSGEQDMRKMGGIWRIVPVTYTMMWVGSLALAGVPPFAGFYSKDIVLEAAWAAQSGPGVYAFWLGIGAAVLTAFYSWRLLFMTFHGAPRADERVMAHVHESPKIMIVPLMVLAVGAIFAGYAGEETFVGEGMKEFWGKSILVLPAHTALADAHHVPTWVKLAPIVVGLAGIALAFYMYMVRTDLPAKLAARFRPVYLFLYNKWYFDELYDWLFVRPAHYLGRELWQEGDGTIIDGLGPDGIASVTRSLAARASRLQTGYVYHYAFAMLIGVAGLVTLYLYLHAR
jgi:NADH-quinone oxidoreductase subunit L